MYTSIYVTLQLIPFPREGLLHVACGMPHHLPTVFFQYFTFVRDLPSSASYLHVACSPTLTGIIRAVSRHDLSHQLATSRTNSQSFPGGADYPTYWVSIFACMIVECGVRLFFFRLASLG